MYLPHFHVKIHKAFIRECLVVIRIGIACSYSDIQRFTATRSAFASRLCQLYSAIWHSICLSVVCLDPRDCRPSAVSDVLYLANHSSNPRDSLYDLLATISRFILLLIVVLQMSPIPYISITPLSWWSNSGIKNNETREIIASATCFQNK